MAQAFPKSSFVGYDFHPGSIAAATAHAVAHGVANVRFEVGRAQDFPGSYDFVTCFDCLHDMGDPAAAAAHIRRALKPDGTWMVVEPNAGDRLEDNLNPVGRLYYSASTMICVPTSLAQETGAALGAQAGEERIAEVIRSGGFARSGGPPKRRSTWCSRPPDALPGDGRQIPRVNRDLDGMERVWKAYGKHMASGYAEERSGLNPAARMTRRRAIWLPTAATPAPAARWR